MPELKELDHLAVATRDIAARATADAVLEEAFCRAREVLPLAACLGIWHVAGRTEGGVCAGWDLSQEDAFSLALEAVHRVGGGLASGPLGSPRFVRRHRSTAMEPKDTGSGVWADFPYVLGGDAVALFSVLTADAAHLGQRTHALLAALFSCAAPSLAHLSLANVNDLAARTDAATRPQDLADVGRVLDSRVAEARSRGHELSVMLVDAVVDGCLYQNAAQAYEEAMSASGGLIVNTLRDSDAVYRLGERRFVVIMLRTSPRNALIAADRIMARLTEHRGNGRMLPERLVIGVAGLDDDVRTSDDLYAHAEAALAQAYASDSGTAFVYL